MADELTPAAWEVYDGWYSHRARVAEWRSPIRRRDGFRFVRERRFARFSWEQVGVSRWYETREACERAARIWLDGIVHDGDLVT